jgi:hypothetical protein
LTAFDALSVLGGQERLAQDAGARHVSVVREHEITIHDIAVDCGVAGGEIARDTSVKNALGIVHRQLARLRGDSHRIGRLRSDVFRCCSSATVEEVARKRLLARDEA